MEIIEEIEDFEKMLKRFDRIVFFVHSPWSASSMIGLRKIKELKKERGEFNCVIIDNSSANSFVYEWLKKQELKNWAGTDRKIESKNGSWIHGNGELIGLKY